MTYLLSLLLGFLALPALAQNLHASTEDGRKVILAPDGKWHFDQSPPLAKEMTIRRTPSPFETRKTAASIKAIEVEIDSLINGIMNKYISQPNTETTWAKIRGEASTLLYQYFRQGKFVGTKAPQAFFVKMDMTTMTSNDIANKKMILLYGIALIKPSEFTYSRIEKVTR